ncbi:MAG: peptide transporter permease [Thermomicrobiales bacterium]|jgi:peptide/nickel transport system permease protein|nr:peptide transporter permease [Thermomicrobiales bacterium]
MTSYVLRRLLLAIPVLIGIMTAVFVMLHAIPGDPALAMAGEKGTVESVERIREELGLNRPLPVQYAYFLKAAATLDFGNSTRTNQPVAGEVRQFFGATIELSVAALIIALFVGIPAGVIAANHRGSSLDYGTMVVALIGISTPVFWAGIVLIYLLSFRLGIFPIGGIIGTGINLDHITYTYVLDSVLTGNWTAFRSSLHHLLLPAIVLSTIPMAIIARMTRSSMLEVLGQDYLRTARAKGLEDRLVVVRHALKNALIPIVTAIGLQFGALISGAFLTETVFGRPGLGRYVVQAIGARDYPAIQGTVLVVAVAFVLINLLVDVAYAAIDPRIHYA